MITPELFSDQEVGELEDRLIGDKCRFCGHEDRPFVENEGRLFRDETSAKDEFWSEGPFRVHCEKCNRYGPSKRYPWQAIRAWNRMPKGIKKGKSDGRHDSRQRKR